MLHPHENEMSAFEPEDFHYREGNYIHSVTTCGHLSVYSRHLMCSLEAFPIRKLINFSSKQLCCERKGIVPSRTAF